jgi:uncharacterized membrane protein YagU involved in acid resistance
MKYQVNAITPLKAGKVFAAVSFLVTWPFLLLSLLAYDLIQQEGLGYSLWAMLVVPLVNALFGFIFGFLLAFCYNLVAKRFGGFELTLQEKAS